MKRISKIVMCALFSAMTIGTISFGMEVTEDVAKKESNVIQAKVLSIYEGGASEERRFQIDIGQEQYKICGSTLVEDEEAQIAVNDIVLYDSKTDRIVKKVSPFGKKRTLQFADLFEQAENGENKCLLCSAFIGRRDNVVRHLKAVHNVALEQKIGRKRKRYNSYEDTGRKRKKRKLRL